MSPTKKAAAKKKKLVAANTVQVQTVDGFEIFEPGDEITVSLDASVQKKWLRRGDIKEIG